MYIQSKIILNKSRELPAAIQKAQYPIANFFKDKNTDTVTETQWRKSKSNPQSSCDKQARSLKCSALLGIFKMYCLPIKLPDSVQIPPNPDKPLVKI